ncbi:HEXXH motif-containing protein [Lentzea fradiae]|uniref:HEXXH motif-containing protein n=1 Tax=Lentzea fradiae TaxID=200378 RepID=A0A1G7N3Y6_9PSEU|nr:HEXXH motif domain-containing protein [Lentzea fradiae]SDF68651.1 HEXXH motif-containing protein [Lentzea fradiae]
MSAGAVFHHMPWHDFDALARLQGDAPMVRGLRRAECSRRKLLLHSLVEGSAKTPELYGPLPPVDVVLELLARVEYMCPEAFEELLIHPYTGSWAGYTTRLLRDGIDGACPLWMHLGHLHAITAASAIRAGLDFEIEVPLWDGNASLPSLGLVRLPFSTPHSVATVRGGRGSYVVANELAEVSLPHRIDADAPGWQHVRERRCRSGPKTFAVRLDDIDPYRGLYEPLPPERLDAGEFGKWGRLLDEAWRFLTSVMPEFAEVLATGLTSLVPRPRVPFQNPSASTGEAFGSAVVGRPTDGADLAATMVHEFQHIVLGGVLHLTKLYESDPRERIYAPWRDDPRPLSGVLQGVYAFFGVTAFWRELARAGTNPVDRRAWFEFAFWRGQVWRTLLVLRDDATLTGAGRRFLAGIEEVLGPWQQEPVPEDVERLAAATAADHRAGWRLRHLRPDPAAVSGLARAWREGRAMPPVELIQAGVTPTPVPDGSWPRSRAALVRLSLTEDGRAELPAVWRAVPDATRADFSYASGRFADAVRSYRAELRATPDRPASLTGLGLALGEAGSRPASRALLHRPELVRAVHRELRRAAAVPPTPEEVASWIGQLVSG